MADAGRDEQTAASVSLAWLIAANKPLYPLYVWWITGDAWSGWVTAVSAPLYLALPYLARRNGLWARAGVPVLGMADTLLAMKLFGASGGGDLFLAPCVLLAGMALHRREAKIAVALAAAAFVVAVLARGHLGPPLADWTIIQTSSLFSLNLYSVAALCVFIVWRFAPLPKG